MGQNSELDAMIEIGEEVKTDPLIIDEGTIESLIAEYRDARKELDDRRHEWQRFEADTKGRLDEISMQLREIADKLGLNALPSNAGTAYRTLKKHYRVGNWDEILHYIQETGNWQMLEKRIGKLATEEIHKVTGALPPGVEYSAEVEFVIRKNSNSD